MKTFWDMDVIGDACIVRCACPLTHEHYENILLLFDQVVQKPNLTRLFFILNHAEDIDATGLSALIHLHALMADGGRKLYICLPPPNLKEMLAERGLTDFLRILEKEEEMVLRLPEENRPIGF